MKLDFSRQRRQSIDRKINEVIQDFGLPDTPDVKLYLLLDDPSSSKAAAALAIVLGVTIIVSVASMFTKSLLHPKKQEPSGDEAMYWRVLETVVTVIFLTELMLRFAVADALGTQGVR